MAYNSGKRNTGRTDKNKGKQSGARFSNSSRDFKPKGEGFRGSDKGENGYKKTFKSEKGDKKSFDSSREKSFKSGEKKYSDTGDFKKSYRKSNGDDSNFKKVGRGNYKSKRDGGFDKKKFDSGTDKPYRSKREIGSDSFEKKTYNSKDDKKPYKSYNDKVSAYSDESKEYSKSYKKAFKKGENTGEETKSARENYKSKRSFTKNKELRTNQSKFEKPSFSKDKPKRPFERDYSNKSKFQPTKKVVDNEDGLKSQKRIGYEEFGETKSFDKERFDKKNFKKPKVGTSKRNKDSDDLIRLNKYLSNAGIASRRDADVLIKSGAVKVNGVPVTEMGYKIKASDVVTYADAKVRSERKVYLLLNKPKDYITTTDDPQERKTVMDLVANACSERIYPVGRLDRNTTGVLLMTNDGELAKKLTHPKNDIKKIYHVSLNKALRTDDFNQIQEGLDLEDGFIQVDDLAYVGEGKKEIGVEIHSGRNRIVRRIFEHLGYDVIKLDRVTFAGLTKKDLPRSKHRFLTQKEVAFLKMI
ncbi:MAG: rRNA pseudouridine synthase [Bacteroidetes bacterium]|nr:rRNA pseudouridine synthase [Bacteroidota bacterium]MCA6441802.1 rRNA pseudouridine synthase [Bacteroidota bacterium]